MQLTKITATGRLDSPGYYRKNSTATRSHGLKASASSFSLKTSEFSVICFVYYGHKDHVTAVLGSVRVGRRPAELCRLLSPSPEEAHRMPWAPSNEHRTVVGATQGLFTYDILPLLVANSNFPEAFRTETKPAYRQIIFSSTLRVDRQQGPSETEWREITKVALRVLINLSNNITYRYQIIIIRYQYIIRLKSLFICPLSYVFRTETYEYTHNVSF